VKITKSNTLGKIQFSFISVKCTVFYR